jgi:hypothetical protein
LVGRFVMDLSNFIRYYNYNIDEIYIDVFCTSFYQKKWIALTIDITHMLDIPRDLVTSTLTLNDEYEEVVVEADRHGNTKVDYYIQPQAFKKLLLAANTVNSTKVLQSYMIFEECILDYVQYQHEQIKIKDQQIVIKEEILVDCLERLELKDKQQSVIVDDKRGAYVYIATTDVYAANNHYKIGSTTNLTKRLSSYNVGRPRSDKYKYVWTKKCDNNVSLERYILSFVGRWKDTKNAEMVIMPFSDLIKLVEYLCDNHEKAIQIANEFDYGMDQT